MKTMPKQQGAALAVSLILLVAMTILGVATLNGTRLTEKVSSNAQQKAITFETAESALNTISSANDYQTRLRSTTMPNEPDPVIQAAEGNQIGAELDQSNTLGTSVDVSAEVSIQFCGEQQLDDTEMSADEDNPGKTGYVYDVMAVATIANSRARSDHVQREGLPGISFGLKGKCVAPGT